MNKIWFQMRACREVFYTNTYAKNFNSGKAVEKNATL